MSPSWSKLVWNFNRVRFPLRWRGVQLLHKGEEGEEVWHPLGVLLPKGGSAAQPTEDVLSSPDLGWSLGVSGDLFLCMYLLKSEAGRTMEISFGWDWNDMVANVEEEHTKGTDQGAELSFLLDEPRGLHRPCSSHLVFFVLIGVCGNWLPTTATADLTVEQFLHFHVSDFF